MENMEIRARTVEEAIQRAVEELGVSREEIEVTVVREGRSGILGLGTEEAVIRVKALVAPPPEEESDITGTAQETIEKLLNLMGLTGSVAPHTRPIVEEVQEDTPSIVLNIEGDDLGILIGRRGYTLSCFQYLVRLIVGHQTKTWVPIVIDVEGYKQRRYQTLQIFARRIALQVEAKGEPFALEPMSAYERRIVHLTLADHPDVDTQSTGLGEERRVVVIPKD